MNPKEWLQDRTNKPIFYSPLGETILNLLHEMWGIYHLSVTSLLNVEWDNAHHITFVYNHSLSSEHSLPNLLTKCQELHLTLEIKGVGPGYTQMKFYRISRGA